MVAAAGGLGACSCTVSRLALVCAILLAVLSPLLMFCFCVLQWLKKIIHFLFMGGAHGMHMGARGQLAGLSSFQLCGIQLRF